MPWATVADVLDVTGEEVTETQVRVASSMIDTKAGTSDDLPADAVSARDRARLRRAACWQAVHVATRPGLLTEREASTQTSSAGVSDRRDSLTAVLYHPMAILELNGLSWRGTRTEVIAPRVVAFNRANFLNEASDSAGVWSPLP